MGTPGTSRASWHRGHLTSVPCRRGITDSRAPHGQVRGIRVGLGESCMVQSRFCVGLLRNHHHHRVVRTASPLGTVAANSAKLTANNTHNAALVNTPPCSMGIQGTFAENPAEIRASASACRPAMGLLLAPTLNDCWWKVSSMDPLLSIPWGL